MVVGVVSAQIGASGDVRTANGALPLQQSSRASGAPSSKCDRRNLEFDVVTTRTREHIARFAPTKRINFQRFETLKDGATTSEWPR